MKREEVIIKLRNVIRESYSARDLFLNAEISRIFLEREKLQKEVDAFRKQQRDLDANLSRATDDDLKSFYFLYFGTEARIEND